MKLTKKQIISLIGVLTVLIVAMVITFHHPAASRSTYIEDEAAPLGNNDFPADFYVDMSTVSEQSGSSKLLVKYLGTGYVSPIDSTIKNSGDSIDSYIKYSPDVSSIIGDDKEIHWKSLYKVASKYVVIGELRDKPIPIVEGVKELPVKEDPVVKSPYDYPSLSSLIASEVTVDSTVYTNGYYNENDGGAACYRIVSSPSRKADGVFVVALNNGLFAELVFDSNSLFNVAVAGVFPDEIVSDKLNRLFASLKDKVVGFKFNDGTYYLDKKVTLYSFRFEGTGNTVLATIDNFESGAFSMLHCPDDGNAYSISFDNLVFLFDVSNKSTLINQGSFTLLLLFNVNSCNISNCSFIARGSSSAPAYKDNTALLWLKGDMNSVNINNSSFEMDLGTVYSGGVKDNLRGGCLWINGNSETSQIKNVNVSNCYFHNTTSDEAIGFWKGQFSDMLISNCTIDVSNHNSNNMFSYYGGTFNNCRCERTIFNANSFCEFLVKYQMFDGQSNVSFANCEFNANASGNSASSIFYTHTDNNYSSSAAITIDSCSVKSASSFDSFYKINSAVNTSINVVNSRIDASMTRGILVANNSSGITASYTTNNISGISEMLLNVAGVSNSAIFVSNNTISGSLTAKFDQYASIDYSITNNDCYECSSSVLFFANWLDPSYGKSNVIIDGNDYNGSENVSNFLNNRKEYSTEDLITSNWSDAPSVTE